MGANGSALCSTNDYDVSAPVGNDAEDPAQGDDRALSFCVENAYRNGSEKGVVTDEKKVRFPSLSKATVFYDDVNRYEDKMDIWCTNQDLQRYTEDIRRLLLKVAAKEKEMEKKRMADRTRDNCKTEDEEDCDDEDDDDEEEDDCLRGLEEFYEDKMFTSEELRTHHSRSILKMHQLEKKKVRLSLKKKKKKDKKPKKKKKKKRESLFGGDEDDLSVSSDVTTVSNIDKKNELLRAVVEKIGKIESKRARRRAEQDQLEANDYLYNINKTKVNNCPNKLTDNYCQNTLAHKSPQQAPPERIDFAARSA